MNLVYDLDFNQLEAKNMVMQNLASAPENPKIGQHYYNTAQNLEFVWNGTTWVNTMSQGAALLPATTTTLGGVIIGSNVNVQPDGTISISDASTSTKGVIEIATDAEVTTGTSETLAVNPKQLATKQNTISDLATIRSGAALGATAVQPNSVTAGTYTKVTVDTSGLISGVSNITASDIPDLSATYITNTKIGIANGVAALDSTGKVPTAQLPSFVDDVIDSYIVSGATALSAGWLSATDGGSALTPETGKIYVILTIGEYLNKTYRWSGSTYVEISASPAQATETTAGIARIATTAEVTAGTDNTTIVTPAKLGAVLVNSVYKQVNSNPALTPVGGICTWTITTDLEDPQVFVRNASTGEEVWGGNSYTAGTVTIKINSTTTISANTYKAIIIG